TSGIHSGFDVTAMFGADVSQEPGTTIFEDGQTNGFVHFVEWQTSDPVTLASFRLFATGDGAIYAHEREFARFVLKARLHQSDEFTTLYTYDPSHPYTFLDSDSSAIISTNITPYEAKYFRAEFVQRDAGRGFDGPRVLELDVFAASLPNVATGGIPDSWRISYFGSVSDPNAGALADPDGDGANNYQEFIDGT